MVDVVGMVAIAVLVFVLGHGLGKRKEPLVDVLKNRLEEAWQHVATLRLALAEKAQEVGQVRRELGHKRRVAVDPRGMMYAECSVCGLDIQAAQAFNLRDRCAGVRFTDEEWRAAFERQHQAAKELAS